MNDQNQKSQDRLECDKLEQEIEWLKLQITKARRPWWARPSAVFPTVVTFITVLMAFLTGKLEADFKLLQIDRSEIQEEQDQLAKEINEIRQQREENIRLKRELAAEGINVHLRMIQREASTPSDLAGELQDMLDVLSEPEAEKYVPRVQAVIASTDDVIKRGFLLRVLYQARGDEGARARLWELAADPVAQQTQFFWWIFAPFAIEWSDGERIPVLRMFHTRINQQPDLIPIVFDMVINGNFFFGSNPETAIQLLEADREAYFGIVNAAYNTVIAQDETAAIDAYYTLASLCPGAAYACVLDLLDAENIDPGLIEEISYSFPFHEDLEPFDDAPYSFDPQTAASRIEWEEWAAAEKRREVLARFRETDLAYYRQHTPELKELLPKASPTENP